MRATRVPRVARVASLLGALAAAMTAVAAEIMVLSGGAAQSPLTAAVPGVIAAALP